MYPNQQNLPILPPTQNPNKQQGGQNGHSDNPSNYDWINNYPTTNQPTSPKDNSFKKKIIFLIVLLVIGGSAVLFASLSAKKDPSHTPTNEQGQNSQTNEQQNESESDGNNIDDQRKLKLRNIHIMLEAYYADNKQYPTFSNVTDEAWLSEHDILKEDITDPEGSDWQAKNTPTKNSFSYQTNPENCDNQETKCTEYKITTVLSNGSYYDIMNDY